MIRQRRRRRCAVVATVAVVAVARRAAAAAAHRGEMIRRDLQTPKSTADDNTQTTHKVMQPLRPLLQRARTLAMYYVKKMMKKLEKTTK